MVDVLQREVRAHAEDEHEDEEHQDVGAEVVEFEVWRRLRTFQYKTVSQ